MVVDFQAPNVEASQEKMIVLRARLGLYVKMTVRPTRSNNLRIFLC
jgi:hypothetical protein